MLSSQEQSSLVHRLLHKMQQQFMLNAEQMAQIEEYSQFLLAQNQRHNLTGHRDIPTILSNLFADSLAAGKVIDFSSLNVIADVGTGAGFPGLALKIAYPHLKVFLIEVNHKKLNFLAECIHRLGLMDVELIDQDWRTFCRHNNEPVELFVTKAVFDEVEACRMFRHNSLQRDKALVYWTTEAWQCAPPAQAFLQQTLAYQHGTKKGQLALFSVAKPHNIKIIP